MFDDNELSKLEIERLESAMNDMEGVGIIVPRHRSQSEKKNAFFDKAKLWSVISEIITNLYIEKLADKRLILRGRFGDIYMVSKVGSSDMPTNEKSNLDESINREIKKSSVTAWSPIDEPQAVIDG